MSSHMDLLIEKVKMLEEELYIERQDKDTMRHNFTVDNNELKARIAELEASHRALYALYYDKDRTGAEFEAEFERLAPQP